MTASGYNLASERFGLAEPRISDDSFNRSGNDYFLFGAERLTALTLRAEAPSDASRAAFGSGSPSKNSRRLRYGASAACLRKDV